MVEDALSTPFRYIPLCLTRSRHNFSFFLSSSSFPFSDASSHRFKASPPPKVRVQTALRTFLHPLVSQSSSLLRSL